MNTFTFSNVVMARRSYFKENGFNEPPVDQDSRYKWMRVFMDQDPQNYDAAVMMFDEMEDATHPYFLNSMGCIFADEKSSYFDRLTAIDFFRRSFRNADEEEIKKAAADNFLLMHFRHHEIDNKSYPSLYKDPYVVDAITYLGREGVSSKAFQDKGMGNMVQHFAATFYGAGNGVARNDELAAQLHQKIVNDGYGYVMTSVLSLSIRSLFGLGCEVDPVKAENIIAEYRKKNSGVIPDEYHERIKKYSERLQDYEYISASEKISNIYRNNHGAFSVMSILQDVDHQEKTPIIEGMWLFTMLAQQENWPDLEEWYNAYFYTFSSLIPHPPRSRNALPERSVHYNTYKYGPFYNAIGKNNLPVWGEPDRIFQGSDHGRVDQRIPAGWRTLSGVTTDENRNIKMIFNRSVFKPALIFQEDVDVALALAFGEDEFQWPDLGLYLTGYGQHPFPNMEIKGFGPDWLTVTDFGKTFYICDFLSGELAWHLEEFEVSEKGNRKLAMLGHALKQMVADIEGEDPVHPDKDVKYGRIINNNPKFVDYTEQKLSGDNSWSLLVHKIILGIDGGYTDNAKDQEKTKDMVKPENPEWLFRGDTKYKHPKLTQTLTDHFDVIAEVMPVYERLRQLMGMVYVLNHLRNGRGFMPNDETRAKIVQNLSGYKRQYAAIGTGTEYIRSSLRPYQAVTYG